MDVHQGEEEQSKMNQNHDHVADGFLRKKMPRSHIFEACGLEPCKPLKGIVTTVCIPCLCEAPYSEAMAITDESYRRTLQKSFCMPA